MRTPPRVFPALITPFAPDGSIDDEAFRDNVSKLAAAGVEGFVLAGSTGHGPYLLDGERRRLVAAGREALGAESFLVCGIQAESVPQALSQIEEAVSVGADAALVMTPTTLVRGNHERVALFYRKLADADALPIFLYSVPAITGYVLPTEIAVELASHPNIAGMKDSGGDVDRIPKLLSDGGFSLFAGSSRAVNESIATGAHGAITAAANYAAGLVAEALDNEFAQERLTALAAAVERFGLAGTYAAAEATGLVAGSMRLPLQPIDGPEKAAVAALVG